MATEIRRNEVEEKGRDRLNIKYTFNVHIHKWWICSSFAPPFCVVLNLIWCQIARSFCFWNFVSKKRILLSKSLFFLSLSLSFTHTHTHKLTHFCFPFFYLAIIRLICPPSVSKTKHLYIFLSIYLCILSSSFLSIHLVSSILNYAGWLVTG